MVGRQALCPLQIPNEAERTDPATLAGFAGKFGGLDWVPPAAPGSPLTLVSPSGHKAAAFAAQTLLMKRIVARGRSDAPAPLPVPLWLFLIWIAAAIEIVRWFHESNDHLHSTRSMHAGQRRGNDPKSPPGVVDPADLSGRPRGRQTLR